MRPFKSTIPFVDALRLTLEAARPISRTDTVGVGDADGRVIAHDVRSAIDVPPFDRALMDGYAVCAADTAAASPDAPRTLLCRARVLAGEAPSRPLAPGECVEIATGAPLPEGASYLGFIFAHADGPEHAEQALREAHAALRFVIDTELPVLR